MTAEPRRLVATGYGYIGPEDLDWITIERTGWRRAAVLLEPGQSAWNPASTTRTIPGPASVTYDEAPDGGVSVLVEPHPSA